MVNVKHGALGAFKEELFAVGHQLIECVRNVADLGSDSRRHGKRLVNHLLNVNGFSLVEVNNEEVDQFAVGANFGGKAFRIAKIFHMQSASCNLVFIGGTNAAALSCRSSYRQAQLRAHGQERYGTEEPEGTDRKQKLYFQRQRRAISNRQFLSEELPG